MDEGHDWLREETKKKHKVPPLIVTKLISGGRHNPSPSQLLSQTFGKKNKVSFDRLNFGSFVPSAHTSYLPFNGQQKHRVLKATSLELNTPFDFSQVCYQCQSGVLDTKQ